MLQRLQRQNHVKLAFSPIKNFTIVADKVIVRAGKVFPGDLESGF